MTHERRPVSVGTPRGWARGADVAQTHRLRLVGPRASHRTPDSAWERAIARRVWLWRAKRWAWAALPYICGAVAALLVAAFME